MVLFHDSKIKPGADAAHAGERHRNSSRQEGIGQGKPWRDQTIWKIIFPRNAEHINQLLNVLCPCCSPADSPLERSCCRADCWKVLLAEHSVSSCFFWNRDRKSKDIVFNPNPFIPEQGLSMAMTAALPRPIFSS